MRAFLVAVALASALLTFLACPPPAEGEAECKVSDDCPDQGHCINGECLACDADLPPPTDACLPKCGNELGVGQPCTKGGGECNGNDIHALFCTVDQVEDADLVMCTGPCLDASDCGSNSVCEGDPADPGGPKGCVPASCSGEGEGEGEGE